MKPIYSSKISSVSEWLSAVELKSGDPFAFQCSDIGIKLAMIPGTKFCAKLPIAISSILSRIDRKYPQLSNRIIPHAIAAQSAGIYSQVCTMMYTYTQEQEWFNRMLEWLEWLKNNANREYHGYTWGIPFKWLMGTGVLAPANTPMSTVSPYCSDAFYLIKNYSVATSLAKFIINDLKVTYEDETKMCISYSPLDNFQITNVQAYCAAQLYRAYAHTGVEKYKEVAEKLINFVLSEQHKDGFWYYWSSQQPVLSSIDSLHQCYIMQGLYRSYLVSGDERIKNAVLQCINYCKNKLITNELYVKKFPVQKHQYELIDAAEMISTLNILGDSLADDLLDITIERFSTSNPSFASYLNPRNDIPYIRWGQIQMLFAMTQHLILSTKTMSLKEIYI